MTRVVTYFRETDGAPMSEVAPRQYVNLIWLNDQKRSAEESRRAAMRRRKNEWNKEQREASGILAQQQESEDE